jgi:hypothetical protein
LCAVTLVSALSGCAPSDSDLLEYQSRELSVRLRGSMNGVEFCATLSLGEPTDGEIRSFRLEMTAPETLKGVVYKRGADNRLVASVGTVECELDALGVGESVVYLANAFSIEGAPESINSIDGKSMGLSDLDRLTRLDFDAYTVYLDAKSDLPVRIDGKEWELSVSVEVIE